MSDPQDATHDYTESPVSVPPSHETFGRFQLRQEIGQGAFGIVYRAYDPVLEREVAIKVPKLAADRLDFSERFLREAKAAARLQHPNIVTVYDCGTERDRLYIAYELVEGVPLSARIAAERPNHRQAAQWVRSLALALHHAHEQGVLHRDVKPANILLDTSNRPRLTDFGISKDLSTKPLDAGAESSNPVQTHEGGIVGSPAYMAPEQARGDSATLGPHTDQYALGVLLYELLTGRRPFVGTVAEVVAQVAAPDRPPPRPRELEPAIPLALEAIVLHAMTKDPTKRYASCADLAVDLQRWLNGDSVQAPLRIPEGWVLACEKCHRHSPPTAAICEYCGHDLSKAILIDPHAEFLAQHRPVVAEPIIFTVRVRLVRAGLWGVWLLVLVAAGAVLWANWHAAVMQAGGWKANPRPSLLDTLPVLKNFGQLGRGIALGVLGTLFGAIVIAAYINNERTQLFVVMGRWWIAGLAVVLAFWVETTARYKQYIPYELQIAIRSADGRIVKNPRVRVMKQQDHERTLHNRVYADQARWRPFDPSQDETTMKPFTGIVSYTRSPLGFAFDADPDRIIVIVGYEDGIGSCQCDDGVRTTFHHDHHNLAFPLRLVIDANPAANTSNWYTLERSSATQEVIAVPLTIEVP